MEQGVRVLHVSLAVAFLGVGIAAVRAAIRRPNPRTRALAGALGLLGILPALALLGQIAPQPVATWAMRARLPIAAASGLALLVFRHRLMPLPRGVLGALAAAAAASTAAALASGLTSAGPRGSVQLAAVISVEVFWLACVGEPIICFWRTSTHRPVIQRARLRSLSAGYLGIVVVAVTSQPRHHHLGLLLLSGIIASLVVPLLWIALHPPAWLRRSWQARERVSRAAFDAMVRFVGDESSLADRGLTWARAIIGGEGGALIDDEGRIVTSAGIDDVDVVALAAGAGQHAALIPIGGGSAVVAPIPLDSGTGRLIVMSGPFSPLFDEHETDEIATFAATLAIAIDRVRTQRRHRDQSEHYAGVVQAMGDLGEGFIVTDGRRLVHANDAYCRITGYSLDELMAMPALAALAPPDELERLAERRTERMNGGPVVEHYESALIRKDGTRVDLEVSMKILGTQDDPSIVCIIRDITDRKRAEEQLRNAFDREHEAVSRLEALDEMKNAFLSAVSHELRTPLTGVVGFARTLQTLGDTMDPAERTTVIDRLNSNAAKLDRLLADLLDLDRLSRGIIEPKRRPVDLGDLVRSVVREFRASSGREVVVNADPVVADVDRAQIERVVENLVTNAARHTTDDTPIWVIVNETPAGGLIVVEDAGPGVPDELRREIFEPFRQGPSLRAHSPGVGIGLALVRRFIDLHGGTVEVAERKGGGASFRVHLPRSAGRMKPLRGRSRPRRPAGASAGASAGAPQDPPASQPAWHDGAGNAGVAQSGRAADL